MKKLFILAAFALAVQGCFTQKTQVVTNQTTGKAEQMYPGHTLLSLSEIPPAVQSAWDSEHAKVRGKEWYKTDEGFIVYYPYKKLQSRIAYDASGKILTWSREVKAEDVPVTIRDYMKAKYPGIQYGRTYLCYGPNGERNYEVQVESKWESFDGEGKSIGKAKDTGDK